MINELKMFAKTNKLAINLAVSLVGLTTTAAVSWRAGYKTNDLIRLRREEIIKNGVELNNKNLFDRDTCLKLAKINGGALVSAVATGANIVAGYKVSSNRIAGLVESLAHTDLELAKYKEEIGKLENSKEIEERVAKELNRKDPVNEDSTGAALFYDTFSGTPFYATLRLVERAEITITKMVQHELSAEFWDWCYEVGIDPTELPEGFRGLGWSWNRDQYPTTTLRPGEYNGKPCFNIYWDYKPTSLLA